MDIVERLREKAHEMQSPPTMELRQAADEIELLRKERDRLREALEMVRDADNDCHLDGLQTIPSPARAKIDAALKETE